MIDAIVYKHEPCGLVFIHDKLLRVYHLSHQRWAGLCHVLFKRLHNMYSYEKVPVAMLFQDSMWKYE